MACNGGTDLSSCPAITAIINNPTSMNDPSDPLSADAPHALYRGVKLLHDPLRNKGTAFTLDERERLGLHGLLPPRVQSQDHQEMRVLDNLERKTSDLERYIFLTGLQDRNETLFYRIVTNHLKQMMPIVYTPTVGEACQLFGNVFRRPRGLYVSADDRGRVGKVLRNWPHEDVRVIVVTDGERILGLGDLGANGMGIAIGKLVLYTACAGIHPAQCLPVMLDVGTENKSLLNDPLYLGLPQRRLRGAAYDELVDELLVTANLVFPNAVIQLEDFANANAFRLLRRYKDQLCLFDDDIQGTGSVVLSGIRTSMRMTGGKLRDQRFLFMGAGEAGVGIASLIVAALVDEGLSEPEARQRCWFFDSKGLVVRNRTDLAEHKLPFAHEHEFIDDFLEATRALRPTGVIGVAGVPGTFTRAVLEEMASANERPIVMALSNPTSKSECTATQAYSWTSGRAIFASGSPFDPVDHGGTTFVPGQANNAYIFPGVGLGAVASASQRITDKMFFLAAKTLSDQVSVSDLSLGRLYPSLDRIRDVSAAIGTVVAEEAYAQGFARADRPEDLEAYVRSLMFKPTYEASLT
jgi:malate dehydrogenase (oxaloacetate-decarboxylating)(NADP+)